MADQGGPPRPPPLSFNNGDSGTEHEVSGDINPLSFCAFFCDLERFFWVPIRTCGETEGFLLSIMFLAGDLFRITERALFSSFASEEFLSLFLLMTGLNELLCGLVVHLFETDGRGQFVIQEFMAS